MVEQGAKRISDLVIEAQGRITIMAAGGVRLSNVRELLDATGVTEVHSSASRCEKSHTMLIC